MFAFRAAGWHLLDVQAKYRVWAAAVGNDALATRLFQTALDLADDRQGALFAVVRDLALAAFRNWSCRRIGWAFRRVQAAWESADPPRLLRLLEGRSATELDPSVLAALALLDGAMVIDRTGKLLAAGAILRHLRHRRGRGNGGRRRPRAAAIAASRFGPVLKAARTASSASTTTTGSGISDMWRGDGLL